jgi:hypothetical protein
MAFPRTEGIRWAPALVTVAWAEIWKYKGTSIIICGAVSLLAWRRGRESQGINKREIRTAI